MKLVMKLVKESLSFERGQSPKTSMGVGRIVQIKKWLDHMRIEKENYTINDDHTIDIVNDVDLTYKELREFPEFIKFGKIIGGGFDIDHNYLTSLRGCPDIVQGYFSCQYNNLTSLEGMPGSIRGYVFCEYNPGKFTEKDVRKYTVIKGILKESLSFERGQSPKASMGIGKESKIKAWLDEMGIRNYTIKDDFTIDTKDSVEIINRKLEKFPEFIKFDKVWGYFDMDFNAFTDFKGCPNFVDGYFSCQGNRFTSLDGLPHTVNGNFYYTPTDNFSDYDISSVCRIEGKINPSE